MNETDFFLPEYSRSKETNFFLLEYNRWGRKQYTLDDGTRLETLGHPLMRGIYTSLDEAVSVIQCLFGLGRGGIRLDVTNLHLIEFNGDPKTDRWRQEFLCDNRSYGETLVYVLMSAAEYAYDIENGDDGLAERLVKLAEVVQDDRKKHMTVSEETE